MTTAARQAALEGVVLQHQRFKEALKSLGQLGSRATAPGGELAGRARVVIGASGAGKTQLLREVGRQPWATPKAPGQRPFLYVEVPEKVNPRDMVVQTMKALGEPTPTKVETKESILEELGVIFTQIGMRALVFDEAHWLMKSASAAVREANAEFIKSMLNRTGVHMILAGTEELARLYSADVSQTRRRLLTKVHLRPYNWSVPAERAAFQTILQLYEQAIGYPVPSDIGRHDLASRLYLVSGGELGVVVQYLSNAIELVDAAGGRSITADTLGEVHDGLAEELEATVVGDMDAFAEASKVPQTNPFTCSEATLKKLWADRFAPKPAPSRTTRLAPGRALTA